VEANDGWFRKLFGMDQATYKRQPAVRRVDCTAGCTSADLTNILLGYPRNPIWVEGNLDLDTAGLLGAVSEPVNPENPEDRPVMLLVTGQLTISAAVNIIGFVHANNIVWGAGATGASVRGAMVAKDDFVAASQVKVTYDRPVLDIISLRYGSFVRAPGSWNLIFR
jgi:hypothetical protein